MVEPEQPAQRELSGTRSPMGVADQRRRLFWTPFVRGTETLDSPVPALAPSSDPPERRDRVSMSFPHRQKSAAVLVATLLVAVSAVDIFAQDSMQYPLSAVSDGEGTIYVADRKLPGIWSLKDGKLSVYFQASKKFKTPLNAVRCLAIDKDGKLLAGDSATREVYRFDAPDKPVPLTKGYIGIPVSLAVKKDGAIIVGDLETHRVYSVPAAGGKPAEVAVIRAPRGVAVDQNDDVIVLSASSSKGQLLKVNSDGEIEVLVSDQPFNFPHNVVVNSEGIAYVTDGFGKCVWKVVDGKPEKLVSGAPLSNPVGLSRMGDDFLLVDPRGNGLLKLTASGELTKIDVGGN